MSNNNPMWPFMLPGSGNDALTYATGDVDTSLFREYDVRGRVYYGEPRISQGLDEFSSNRIGRAFGTFLERRGVQSVAVGFDSRLYSETLANALTVGLLSTGRDVVYLGMTTTPMVYFAQHAFGPMGGVSITASHNPNGWGGMKLSDKPSVTLGPNEVAELLAIAQSREFATGYGTYREESITERYTQDLASRLPGRAEFKVLVDGGNSISGPIAELALRAAGYNVIAINRELDWTFPNHEPDPESVEARVQASEAVREHGADCGISLDGDGDRLGITDGSGAVVWSDKVLAILARDSLTRHPGSPIVYDVKCSKAVTEVVEAAGGKPVMWKTGHSHIKNKMREVGAAFAGERSGHFFDSGDYLGFDDAVYGALRFLHIASNYAGTVEDMVGELPSYFGTPTMQTECADSEKYRVVEEFASYAETLGAQDIIRINGVRAEFEDGWFLVRASSNLPALVMIVEATSEQRVREMYRDIRNGLDVFGEVDKEWINDPYKNEGC